MCRCARAQHSGYRLRSTSIVMVMGLGRRFSVATIIEPLLRPLKSLAMLVGASPNLVSICPTGAHRLRLSLIDGPQATMEQVFTTGREAIEKSRVNVLVPKCGRPSIRLAIGGPMIVSFLAAHRIADIFGCDGSFTQQMLPFLSTEETSDTGNSVSLQHAGRPWGDDYDVKW